jgi:hypothetical protein
VLYTPDISPAYWLFKAMGLNLPALITDPNWALPAIIAADTWEWFPLTMLMVLAGLQTVPEELEQRRIEWNRTHRGFLREMKCDSMAGPQAVGDSDGLAARAELFGGFAGASSGGG